MMLLLRYDIYIQVYKEPEAWSITGGIVIELEVDLRLVTLIVKEVFVTALYVKLDPEDENSAWGVAFEVGAIVQVESIAFQVII